MIHYSCDCCKRSLDANDDLRYVVRMEVFAALEPLDDGDAIDDRDYLAEIQEILEQMNYDGDEEPGGDEIYRQLRFDLCPECRRKFMKNPLAFKTVGQLNFSEN